MLITSIGSLPFTDVDEAIDLVFSCCPEIPFWPQLPKRSFYEGMYVQCLEHVPTVVMNEAEGTVYVDTGATEGIEQFYEDVQAAAIDRFAISEGAAPGFYRLLERLGEVGSRAKCIKTQLSGPFTLGIGLKDAEGKPIIYDAAYFDIIKKALHMKAEWMIRTIRKAHPGKEIILFFDEPAMVSFGSAFVAVSKEDVVDIFREVAGGLDATVGVHCCGNTDWSVLLNAGVNMINYDAFNFMETLFYFRDELAAFLAHGGRIAPGIVPSSGDELKGTTAEALTRRWSQFCDLAGQVATIAQKEIVVTTACGLGSLDEADARRALALLRELQARTGA
jgi:methionine synthase II (cobalamin-independent)